MKMKQTLPNQSTGAHTYQHLLESIPSMYMIVDVDGHIYYSNPFVAQYLSGAPHDLKEESLFSFTLNEDHPILNYHLSQFKENNIKSTTWEDRKIDQNEEIRWLLNEASLLPNYDQPHILIHSIDITEQKEAEEKLIHEHSIQEKKLKESEQRYRSLFDHHPDPIYILDVKGNFLSVNQGWERMLGYTQREASTMSFHPFIPPEDVDRVWRHFQQAIKGEPQNYNVSVIPRDGEPIETNVTNVPMMINNEVTGVFGIAKNIMEKRMAQELLLESEKFTAVGQLAAGIAHEIRNPLTSLKGFLQMIQGGSSKKVYTDIMEEELNRIEVILSELLSLAKPQDISFKEHNLKTILQDVVTLLDTQAIMNDTQIITNYDAHELYIECDQYQLKQVFINFIKNGIEAMPTGGQLQIDVAKENDTVTIHFSDQGCGIPEDQLSKIRQAFYSTKEKGTGLGLMVSYEIIENHRGHISVSSQVGEGTTFTVVLPVSQSC